MRPWPRGGSPRPHPPSTCVAAHGIEACTTDRPSAVCEARSLRPGLWCSLPQQWPPTNVTGWDDKDPSRTTAGHGHAHLSAGVEDRRLRPGGQNSSGSPDREALPLWQLEGLRQDQGLLPGAVPGQRQLGARQWHRQLLDNEDSQEEERTLGRRPQTTAHTHTHPRASTSHPGFSDQRLRWGRRTAQSREHHECMGWPRRQPQG